MEIVLKIMMFCWLSGVISLALMIPVMLLGLFTGIVVPIGVVAFIGFGISAYVVFVGG